MGNTFKSKHKKSAKLSQNELDYLLKHTAYKKDELINFHKSFLKDCPSGEINKKDFNRLMRSFRSIEEDDNTIDKYSEIAFNAFDSNGDGHISFKEFMISLSITSFGSLEQKIELAFALFDKNKNKRIEKREIEKVLKCMFKLANGKENKESNEEIDFCIKTLMERADKNKDGRLSHAEFKNACLNDDFVRKYIIDLLFT